MLPVLALLIIIGIESWYLIIRELLVTFGRDIRNPHWNEVKSCDEIDDIVKQAYLDDVKT